MRDADAKGLSLLLPPPTPQRPPLWRRVVLASALMVAVEGIFGAYSYLTGKALRGTSLSPLVFAWVRDVIATAALLSVALVYEVRRPVAARRFFPAQEHWLRFLACGLLGVWGSQGLSALALANLDPVFFAVLQPLLPLVTLAAGTLAGVEPPLCPPRVGSGGGSPPYHARAAAAKVAGLLLAVGGAVGVVWSGSSGVGGGGSGGSLAIGLLFLGGQITLGGSYPVAQRPLLSTYTPIFTAAYGYAAGLFILSLSVATGATEAAGWAFTPSAAGAVAFAGVFGSAVAYGFMAIANSLVGPVLLVAFFPLLPVTTALIAAIADGRVITLGEILGGGVIAVGLCAVVAAKLIEGDSGATGGGSEAVDADEEEFR